MKQRYSDLHRVFTDVDLLLLDLTSSFGRCLAAAFFMPAVFCRSQLAGDQITAVWLIQRFASKLACMS
ncbi:hypothetical protein JM49_25465 [Pseudomonas chlororaphis subsp. aurantiaca]|nr:hypothetical protein JM49_25465 [Pseudomonas chlororaphis subsp. aurantiaca]